jgi:hypothetical protein
MPTIDQLAPATAASDTDEFMVSQNGVVRSVTRAQVLAGVQPELSVASGTLLGGPSTGCGGPQQIGLGANLTLVAGTLSAIASPFIVAALPAGNVPAAADSVPIGQAGTNVAVSYAQFVSGLPGVTNVDGSQLLVVPTSGIGPQRLGDFAASTLQKSGATLTGSFGLAGDPSTALQAATKQYVDVRVSRSGDTMTGFLVLSGDPTVALGAVTKEYADRQIAGSLSTVGGTMIGPLGLAGDPTTALHAVTKEYVDCRVQRSGDTLTGPLVLASEPSVAMDAASKEYVDARVYRSGDTMMGLLMLSADPAVPLGATTKQYTDSQIAKALLATGGTMIGPLSLWANPTTNLQAAPKQYVDEQVASALPLTGGALSGLLLLAGDPSGTMGAATKQYVDFRVGTALPLAGGTLAGPLSLPANPSAALQAAPKQYVDAKAAASLSLAGGTMSGALTLASSPSSSLQAATKSYVDARVQRSGDTMTGPLAMSQPFTGSGAPTLMAATRAQSAIGDSSVVSSSMTLAFAGGLGSSNINTLLTTNVDSNLGSNGDAADGPSVDVYSLVSYLNSSALRPLNASPTAARHFSIQSAPTRSLPPGGIPAGRQMAGLWGLWLPIVDQTNLPSSVSNSLFGNETDLQANNIDDANCRVGLMLSATEAVPLASGGYPLEWAYGIITTTSMTAQFKSMVNLRGNYCTAVIDTRNACSNGAAGTPPAVTASLSSPTTGIHVSNVLPFTSSGQHDLPVSSSNAAQVKIGSGTYALTGYSFDGPGLQSGTITLSTPVSVADGTTGNLVTNSSRTIWLATGQQIAFDYDGATTAFYDSSIGALRVTSAISADGGLLFDRNSATSLIWNSTAFSPSGGAYLQGNLMVTGTLYTPSSFVAGGATNLVGPVTVNDTMSVSGASSFQNSVSMSAGLTISSGTLVTNGSASIAGSLSVGGGTIGLPTHTVTALPLSTVGALAYATNGRKTGEAAGAGTGVLVIGGNGNQWISVMSGTTVLA